MKLNTSLNNVQDSNVVDLGIDFTIGDPSIIIQVLRKNFYANPIQTLVQEYICNGRDATREAKKETPVDVTLPNRLSPILKVRDYGVGLSETRIKEVFTQYGKSTKRHSNEQTGGFGIGAKSAWSYTDSFTIVSFIDGKKATYIAHIGKNHNGTLQRFGDVVDTNEPNGTEIQIGVKEYDLNKFIQAVYRTTMFWTVRPNIKGILPAEIPKFYSENVKNPTWSGKNWAVYRKEDLAGLGNQYGNSNHLIVVDGIPYPMQSNLNNVDNYSEVVNDLGYHNQLVIFVNNGDVEVVANRETMADSDYTRDGLSKIFAGVKADMDKKYEAEVAEVKTLDDLIAKYQKFTTVFSRIEPLTLKVKKEEFQILENGSLVSPLIDNAVLSNFKLNKQRSGRIICSRDEAKQLYFGRRYDTEKTVVFYQDIEEGVNSTRERIRNFLNNDLKTMVVLLNTKETTVAKQYESLLIHLKARKLSELPMPEKPETEKVERVSRKGKFCLHYLSAVQKSAYNLTLGRESAHLTEDELDKTKKYLYVRMENGAIPEDMDASLVKFVTNNGYTLVGSSDKVINKVKGFKCMEDYTTFVKEVTTRIPLPELEKNKLKKTFSGSYHKFDMIKTSLDKIEDKRILTLANHLSTIPQDQGRSELAQTIQALYKPEVDKIKEECESMNKLYEKIMGDYPLWASLDHYASTRSNSKIIKDLVDYINTKRNQK